MTTLAKLASLILEHPALVGIEPTDIQMNFLLSQELEVGLLGGTGRGGTTALAMAAAIWTDYPQYRALLLRRQYSDLSLSGGLLDVCRRLYIPAGARYNQETHSFTFPSGAVVQLGYCSCDADLDHWRSSQYHHIAVDECQDWPPSHYNFFFSRLRKREADPIPLQMRVSGNPGGRYAQDVRDYWIRGSDPNRRYIIATFRDNPHLNGQLYEQSLMKLDAVSRQQSMYGDYEIEPEGNMFQRSWFKVIEQNEVPAEIQKVRAWDLAASTATSSDWTAGALMAQADGVFYLVNIDRFKGTPKEVFDRMGQTAQMDGIEVAIALEQEPGSAGKLTLDTLQRDVLMGYNIRPQRPIGDKVTRAGPLSSACEAGNVVLVRGNWLQDFIDEATLFPVGRHDDQVDAVALAFNTLAATSGANAPACETEPLYESDEAWTNFRSMEINADRGWQVGGRDLGY